MSAICLRTCLIMALLAATLPAADSRSGMGLNSTGQYPARNVVTTFWDWPSDCGAKGFGGRGWGAPATTMDSKAVLPDGASQGSQKNIAWRATLPHWGNNAPVVVGDQVFLMTQQGWKSDCPELVCLDVNSGAILWQRPVDHLDAPGVPAEAKKARAIEIQRYKDFMKWWNHCYYNNDKRDWARHSPESFKKVQAEADAAGWTFINHKWTEKNPKDTRGRMGLTVSRRGGGAPKDKSLIDNYKKVIAEGWHRYQGWSTEAPWYGMTHGSVISDGKLVYCFTGLGGAVAYDLSGKRQWATWLKWEKIPFSTSTGSTVGHHLANPALVDGTLVFYFFDGGAVYGLDTKTGKVNWKTDLPTKDGTDKRGKTIKNMVRKGGHMGPGSTPAIVHVNGTALAVLGNGMVVRVSDGKNLGWIPGAGRFYYSIVAKDDVVYLPAPHTALSHQLQAVRIKLDGDTLDHEVLWTTPDGKGNLIRSDAPNLILDGDKIYNGNNCWDAKTGKKLGSVRGGIATSYPTGLASSAKYIIGRSSGWQNKDYQTFVVIDKASMSVAGRGFLGEPPASGEIQDRHIAFMGFPELHMGCPSYSAWGNRIFIRSNDYLWCIGDPKKSYQED